jgi:tetratricopeptide (TPR) repeat protein
VSLVQFDDPRHATSPLTASGATPGSQVLGSPRGRRIGTWRRALAVGAAGIMVIGLLIALPFPARHRAEIPKTEVASGVGAAASAPTPVTDLPLPASKNPDAIAAYAAAMQGIRDGNWGYVTTHLERAIALDPGLAAAHLRLAIVQNQSPLMRQARVTFGRALLGRARLSERDQALLNAFEPVLNRDPPDRDEQLARLRAATERYPRDAELCGILAGALPDAEDALPMARRSVELDPQYADGWQLVGGNLFKLGKTDEGLQALDRCIALSPATADCRGERGFIYASEGRCAEMEDDLRRAVASSTSGVWQDGRATALFALGRPPEAVLEVYRNKWAQLPEADRAVSELLDRSNLNVAIGHFKEAEEQIHAARHLVASDSEAFIHARLALQLV